MTTLKIKSRQLDQGDLAPKVDLNTTNLRNVKLGYFFDSDQSWGLFNRIGLSWKYVLTHFCVRDETGYWITPATVKAFREYVDGGWRKASLDDVEYGNWYRLLRRFLTYSEEDDSPIKLEV